MVRRFLEEIEFDIEASGTLIPSSWSEEGAVDGLILEVEEDEEYRILMDEKGKSLLPYMKSLVTLYGPYWVDDWGTLWLKVEALEIIREPNHYKIFKDGGFQSENQL